MSAKKETKKLIPNSPSAVPPPQCSAQPISALIAIAATFLTVPGTVLYLATIIVLQAWEISLEGNLLAPLLLLSAGLALLMLVILALSVGVWTAFQSRALTRMTLLCIWINGIILAGLIALIALAPQMK